MEQDKGLRPTICDTLPNRASASSIGVSSLMSTALTFQVDNISCREITSDDPEKLWAKMGKSTCFTFTIGPHLRRNLRPCASTTPASSLVRGLLAAFLRLRWSKDVVETSRLKPFGPLKPPCAGNTASDVWLIAHAVMLDTSHDAMRKAELYPLRQHPQMQVRYVERSEFLRRVFALASRPARPCFIP